MRRNQLQTCGSRDTDSMLTTTHLPDFDARLAHTSFHMSHSIGDSAGSEARIEHKSAKRCTYASFVHPTIRDTHREVAESHPKEEATIRRNSNVYVCTSRLKR